MEKYLQEHFLSESHNGFITEVEIVFIDKTYLSDLIRRDKFWRPKLKTSASDGLNLGGVTAYIVSLATLVLDISIILLCIK